MTTTPAFSYCRCGARAPMTAGDCRWIRQPGWTEQTVDLRLVIRCPECSK